MIEKQDNRPFLISLFAVIVFLCLSSISHAVEHKDQRHMLSPNLSIGAEALQRNFDAVFPQTTLLSNYEYYKLALDRLIGTRKRLYKIETAFRKTLSPSQIVNFQKKYPQDLRTRIQVRNKFYKSLKHLGIKDTTAFQEYLDIIMARFYEHMRDKSESEKESVITFVEQKFKERLSKEGKDLTYEDILVLGRFSTNSMLKHATKKRVRRLFNDFCEQRQVYFGMYDWEVFDRVIERLSKYYRNELKDMIAKNKRELKANLLAELSLRQMDSFLYYKTGYNIEHQQAQAKGNAVFLKFLKKHDIFHAGHHWEYFYKVVLESTIKELYQEAALINDLSIRKMRGMDLSRSEGIEHYKKAFEIMSSAMKYSRGNGKVRKAVDRIFISHNEVDFDGKSILRFSPQYNYNNEQFFYAKGIYVIDNGWRVLHVTAKGEFVVFQKTAPFIRVYKEFPDMSQRYRDLIKDEIKNILSALTKQEIMSFTSNGYFNIPEWGSWGILKHKVMQPLSDFLRDRFLILEYNERFEKLFSELIDETLFELRNENYELLRAQHAAQEYIAQKYSALENMNISSANYFLTLEVKAQKARTYDNKQEELSAVWVLRYLQFKAVLNHPMRVSLDNPDIILETDLQVGSASLPEIKLSELDLNTKISLHSFKAVPGQEKSKGKRSIVYETEKNKLHAAYAISVTEEAKTDNNWLVIQVKQLLNDIKNLSEFDHSFLNAQPSNVKQGSAKRAVKKLIDDRQSSPFASIYRIDLSEKVKPVHELFENNTHYIFISKGKAVIRNVAQTKSYTLRAGELFIMHSSEYNENWGQYSVQANPGAEIYVIGSPQKAQTWDNYPNRPSEHLLEQFKRPSAVPSIDRAI